MTKQRVEGFIQQLQHATQLGERADAVFPLPTYVNVVIAGMGSSGVAGDLVRAYVADKLEVPLVVLKSYDVPAFVAANTLFIAVSFSGNTEETLEAIRTAMKRGAYLAVVTSGGEMQRLAQQNRLPHLLIPAEAGPPRASLGYMLVSVLYLLHQARLLDDTFKTELEQSINLLQEQHGSIKVQASALAAAFQGKLPVLYAGSTFQPVVVRFQQQLNAQAKQLAHGNVFPEVNHHEVEGWRLPEELVQQAVVLLVHTAYEHPRVRVRMDLCKPVLAEKGYTVLEIAAAGATYLEQALYLVHLFDWVSVYLAELNGVDAGTTETIDHLKEKLSRA